MVAVALLAAGGRAGWPYAKAWRADWRTASLLLEQQEGYAKMCPEPGTRLAFDTLPPALEVFLYPSKPRALFAVAPVMVNVPGLGMVTKDFAAVADMSPFWAPPHQMLLFGGTLRTPAGEKIPLQLYAEKRQEPGAIYMCLSAEAYTRGPLTNPYPAFHAYGDVRFMGTHEENHALVFETARLAGNGRSLSTKIVTSKREIAVTVTVGDDGKARFSPEKITIP